MTPKKMKPTYQPEHGIRVRGRLVSMELAYALVQASIFFVVEPDPGEYWIFYVKKEAFPVLEQCLEIAKAAAKERCLTCDAKYAGHEPHNCQILKSTGSCRFLEE